MPETAAVATGPTHDDLRLAGLVLHLADRVKQSVREVGDELGLSSAQLDVLRRLDSTGPIPMSRLAEIMGCEASNLTGLVDKLETRRLVERRADPSDRRVRLLALTEDGANLHHQTWFAVSERCPFMNLPEEKRAVLDLLLREALQRALPNQ